MDSSCVTWQLQSIKLGDYSVLLVLSSADISLYVQDIVLTPHAARSFGCDGKQNNDL